MTYLERLKNQRPLAGRTDKTDESPPPKTERGLSVPPEGLAHFEGLATGDPPGPLYSAWLGPPQDPPRYGLAALTPQQARQAVAAGAVHAETARACILIAVRTPSGACGLLAIPRERYDGWRLLELLAGSWGPVH